MIFLEDWMKKPDVIKQIADVSGLTQSDINIAIKALVKVIQNNLKNGESVSLSGLGSFKSKDRKARQGRNPKTGAIVPVPAGKKVSFKPTTTLRKLIQK
jgi:predicted histone-like DNA-binding protein